MTMEKKELDELKEKLEKLKNKLIAKDDGSLIAQYNQYEKNFNCSEIEKENITRLEGEYKKFNDLLKHFYENYKQLFKIEINEEVLIADKKNIKIYLDIGQLYIDIIQNIYLNPINYRINQLNAEKNNNKARMSIYLGIASVVLAVVAIFISFVLQDWANKSGKQTNKQLLGKADSVYFKVDTCKHLLEKTDNISLKIDSFYLFIKENKTKAISFGERKDTVKKIRNKTTL